MFPWRTALLLRLPHHQPLSPAQTLYPRAKDRLVLQINSGHHSIVNCPGTYSLQVAQFSGCFAVPDRRSEPGSFRSSPAFAI